MPTEKTVILTTKVVAGIGFTRGALVDATESINGNKALRIGLEHDPHYPPLGKIRAAEVIDFEEESVVAVIDDRTHVTSAAIHETTGDRIIEVNFPNDERPFVQYGGGDFKAPITVTVDGSNFDNHGDFQEFLDTKDKEDGVEATSSMVRRSIIPEPLIQFGLSNPEIVGALTWLALRGEKFLRYTIDETARKMGDAISDKVSESLKKWLGMYNALRSTDDRAATSHIIINVEPQIHLLTRSQEIEQSTHIGIDSLCRRMELHKDLLEDADSVTFARTAQDEEWELLYITTKSGKVITTEECYEATVRRQEEIARTIPICLCLEHKTTKEVCHYETTAIATKMEESGRFEMQFDSVPDNFEEYELTSVSLLLGEKAD